jgi:hypothetical protein
MPCLASASRWGVRPRSDPRNPMRSARVVSTVIRMMLGRRALGLGGAVAKVALARRRMQVNTRESRIKSESLAWLASEGLGGIESRGLRATSRNATDPLESAELLLRLRNVFVSRERVRHLRRLGIRNLGLSDEVPVREKRARWDLLNHK